MDRGGGGTSGIVRHVTLGKQAMSIRCVPSCPSWMSIKRMPDMFPHPSPDLLYRLDGPSCPTLIRPFPLLVCPTSSFVFLPHQRLPEVMVPPTSILDLATVDHTLRKRTYKTPMGKSMGMQDGRRGRRARLGLIAVGIVLVHARCLDHGRSRERSGLLSRR